VYRSKVYFDDVTGMKPYASGLTDPRLRNTQTTDWLDRYPTDNVYWFYAVTIVNGKGQEEKSVSTVKVFRYCCRLQELIFFLNERQWAALDLKNVTASIEHCCHRDKSKVDSRKMSYERINLHNRRLCIYH